MSEPLLEVRDLRVAFATESGPLQAVDGVSLSLAPGEVLAVVGESGSGKSVTAMSLTGLTRGPRTTITGSVRFRGEELVDAPGARLQRVRGAGIAMVFQDPMTALNPLTRVGPQIVEQIQVHEREVSDDAARERAVTLLDRVGIPRPGDRFGDYPHQFSGGMRQRAMIAMALSCSPAVLVADEPTTALDVTVQAQILAQLAELRAATQTGIILVTHDLGVVADVADRAAVMYGGRIVEEGPVDAIFGDPQHPYTWGLLGSITRIDRPRTGRLPAIAGAPPSPLDPPQGCHFRPRCPHAFDACGAVPALESRSGAAGHLDRCLLPVAERPAARAASVAPPAASPFAREQRAGAPLLAADALTVHFPVRRGVLISRTVGAVHAVDDVSLTVRERETVGLVGESGCGKSTLARTLLRLVDATGGAVRFGSEDVTRAGRGGLRGLRSDVQMVFQDPYASLNPRLRVREIVGAPLRRAGVDAGEAAGRVRELLARVGLGDEHLDRYPHEFSGGQRQRIGLARALAVRPRLVVLDEPVSALDVSIRAQIVNLLDDLQEELGLAYLFVAHDIGVVRHVSDRIAVMYLGRIVEVAPADALHAHPVHPYTSALLAAIPIPDPVENRRRPRREIPHGEVPDPIDPPAGCRFHPRCPRATDVCRTDLPPLVEHRDGHLAACHHPQ